MKKIETEVLVIGGGATGAGVARDLALRGFEVILLEKCDLATGTTGRYHGLLHSGGRYAVRDPLAAKECIAENRILREIMPHCIEDTGGFFVLTPWDDPDYIPKFLEGCRVASIPVEEATPAQMLREEPLLNPRITRCLRVPDGSADSFRATEASVESARQHRARVWTYHQVLDLVKQGDQVTGARCRDLVKDELLEVYARLVVNAAGAWAGKIAASAGIQVQIIPGKGTLLAMNHRIVNTVINRCKLPSDGDILVPAHTVAVIGTTDVKVADPDHFAIEPWETHLLLEEGEKLIPGFKGMRIVRSWAGVRPLYQEKAGASGDNRQVTRAFALLDHEKRDGIAGLITITGGKWVTHRKMAEVTVDLICEMFGVTRPCRTHLEPLPGAEKRYAHSLGTPLAHAEVNESYGRLVCECELVDYQEVVQAITSGEAKTIDDIRRDVRLGMGPCQGGFCTYRIAGILHTLRRPPVEETNVALRDFLQERWKGLLPILWGQQLRQERLDELIYMSVLNADHLPGPSASGLGPALYQTAKQEPFPLNAVVHKPPVESPSTAMRPSFDLVVVGAGLAGLAAAWQATQRGWRVRLISKGWGALYWHAGCVDVLGYYPPENAEPLASPREGIERLRQDQPQHPYALALQAGGPRALDRALGAFKNLCAAQGYPLHGSLDANWLLPTALGTPRPTCLAPETMIAGDLRRNDPILVVGFEGFLDFYPSLVADNLAALHIPTSALTLDMPALRERRFVTSRTLAIMFDQADFRAEVAEELKARLGRAARVGFPAILGIERPLEALRDLQMRLGVEVFEIPLLPVSIPGMRLARILRAAIERADGSVLEGMLAVSAEQQAGRICTLWSEAAARRKAHRAFNFILATGGILGGGLHGDPSGCVRETVMDLPVHLPEPVRSAGRAGWFQRQFLAPEGHPVFSSGIRVDAAFRPVGADGQPLYANLRAVGGVLAYVDAIRERSLEGIALVTGFIAGNMEE